MQTQQQQPPAFSRVAYDAYAESLPLAALHRHVLRNLTSCWAHPSHHGVRAKCFPGEAAATGANPTPHCLDYACTVPAQALLQHLFKDKNSKLYRLYQYEDGHILDLAAGNGDAKMVQLLLDFNMTVGPSAMAHAAHRNHTAVMEVRASTSGCQADRAADGGRQSNRATYLVRALKCNCAASDTRRSH
jgi:hypothetical protein